MDIVVKDNKFIRMSARTESGVIKDILTVCKIKHYHIRNEDKLLEYKDRKFIDGTGNRVYLDMNDLRFKESRHFWNNYVENTRSRVVCLDYKPSQHKLNALLRMLNSYNNLSELNYIPEDERITL